MWDDEDDEDEDDEEDDPLDGPSGPEIDLDDDGLDDDEDEDPLVSNDPWLVRLNDPYAQGGPDVPYDEPDFP